MEYQSLIVFFAVVVGSLLLLAGVLHGLPRLGDIGRTISGLCQRAPGLDLLVTLFTVLPWGAGAVLFGWRGLLAGVVGQIVAVQGWIFLHELANTKAVKGPRILKVLNSRVGRLRNYTAVWITALAIPVFWVVRVAEWVVYPPLVLLVKFPRYNQAEWVNVSRQKFDGLVGWDLVWCLYCDWMTGIWSLGTEMLRNVESFWCPIRFDSGKKCENCKIDFPDVAGGWVKADGNMQDVARVLEEKYPSGLGQRYSWFGHPSRLGVKNKPCSSEKPDDAVE
jgi:hypothetical protein